MIVKNMSRNDIVWLHNKLKYETIGEQFDMNLDHWLEMFEDVSDKWFNRMRALFYNGKLEELSHDLEVVGIKKINK